MLREREREREREEGERKSDIQNVSNNDFH